MDLFIFLCVFAVKTSAYSTATMVMLFSSAVRIRDYGFRVARELGRLDLGQSVVVCDGACVALEAMEGTDAVIRRAASLVNGQGLAVVKLAKPNQDLRFDVPVVGPGTLTIMVESKVTALAIEARKTLMIDRDDLIRTADENNITIVAVE